LSKIFGIRQTSNLVKEPITIKTMSCLLKTPNYEIKKPYSLTSAKCLKLK